MNKKIVKSVLLIGIMTFLSMGAMAQQYTPADLGTHVYFQTLPTKPANLPSNATVIVKWYIPGGSIMGFKSGPVAVQDDFFVEFTGTMEEATSITSTKVELSFYNGYTGTSKTFPGFPALVTCTQDFRTVNWWVIYKKDPLDRGATPQYTITQTTTAP
jgi:hypothetical protein